MKKCIFLVVMPLFFILSCGRQDLRLQDGYYTAEAVRFDLYGWKEYVTICINRGVISRVEYNAKDLSGFIKSWDMSYMRLMNAACGTYPNEYTRLYSAQLLKNQGLEGIEALSGASESYRSFTRLAEAALVKARDGDTSVSLVDVQEPGGGM